MRLHLHLGFALDKVGPIEVCFCGIENSPIKSQKQIKDDPDNATVK